MKIRTILGLTLVGAAIYAHKQNGGDLTVASMKKSFGDLWSKLQAKAFDMKAKAKDAASKAEAKANDVVKDAKQAGKNGASRLEDEDYGPSGYTPRGRH